MRVLAYAKKAIEGGEKTVGPARTSSQRVCEARQSVWRPVRLLEGLGGQPEGLGGQPEGLETSHRVWEASQRVKRPARGFWSPAMGTF